MGNVFFDTCVYHQPGIDLLLDVDRHPTTSCSARRWSARCAASTRSTGHHFDDTRRYVEAPWT